NLSIEGGALPLSVREVIASRMLVHGRTLPSCIKRFSSAIELGRLRRQPSPRLAGRVVDFCFSAPPSAATSVSLRLRGRSAPCARTRQRLPHILRVYSRHASPTITFPKCRKWLFRRTAGGLRAGLRRTSRFWNHSSSPPKTPNANGPRLRTPVRD